MGVVEKIHPIQCKIQLCAFGEKQKQHRKYVCLPVVNAVDALVM
jgi:hypothetical protein